MEKRAWLRVVERELYQYPALRVAAQSQPALVPSYEGMPGGGGISNPTERVAILRAEKSVRVQMVDACMEALTLKERELIRYKYFDPRQPSDIEVMAYVSFKSTAYYKIKEQALKKMALAMNII